MTSIVVRNACSEDISGIVEVEKCAWGEHGASEKQIAQRVDRFAEGNPVLVLDDKIVGFGSTFLVSSLPTGDFTWDSITACGTIECHDPTGNIMYGVNASAVPGKCPNVLEYLVGHCLDTASKYGCHTLCLGSRIPGYKAWSYDNAGGVQEYVESRSRQGRAIDPELALYQSHGFEIGRPLKRYFPDEGSLDWGVLVSMKL